MTELTCLQSDAVETTQYDGFLDITDLYPKWMKKQVVKGFIYSDMDDASGIFPAIDDWFICNKFAEVKLISDEEFHKNFYQVDDDLYLACLKTHTIECVVFDGAGYGDWESYPRWLRRLLEDDGRYINDIFVLHDQPLCPGDVFLRNNQGHIRWVDEDTFKDNYYIVS